MARLATQALPNGLPATSGTASPERLDRRRVYIFPSRAGFTLGAMMFVILLGAINYDNALGYLLTFLLVGLFLVAMVHTYRNLVGLRFAGARAAPVFAGETASFECLLANDRARPRYAIDVCHWPPRLDRERRRYLERYERRATLGAHATTTLAVPVEAHRRGWLPLTRIRLRSLYPLGTLRTWAFFESDARCLVYPAPRGELPLPEAPGARGGRGTSTHAGTDDFAGMRPYSPGDPARAIAWKTLAKEQELLVKRFQDSAAERIWLDWRAVAGLAHVEARLSQLTRWVLDASAAGVTFGLEIPGERIAFGHGPAHRDRCLRALALYEVAS